MSRLAQVNERRLLTEYEVPKVPSVHLADVRDGAHGISSWLYSANRDCTHNPHHRSYLGLFDHLVVSEEER